MTMRGPLATGVPLPTRWRAAEFFAGIGLAGHGMRNAGIEVVWSNDISPTKHALFKTYHPDPANHTFVLGDLGDLDRSQLPESVDLAWASFPCTDLSVAGGRAGLVRGTASATFWHFIKALSAMGDERPQVVALENVTAFATSRSGRDITSAIRALNGLGYSVDALALDARHFVPQSRPRLFIVATRSRPASTSQPHAARPVWLESILDDRALVTHRMELPDLPKPMVNGLESYLECMPENDARWWESERVGALVSSLVPLQRARLDSLMASGEISCRTAYRRMRAGVPRWEIRSDGVAGCLRTSSGGSSKQAVLHIGGGSVRARWMTPREYGALMGVPDFPVEGRREHHLLCGFGDAVCAPVVEWLSENYLVPLLEDSLGRGLSGLDGLEKAVS